MLSSFPAIPHAHEHDFHHSRVVTTSHTHMRTLSIESAPELERDSDGSPSGKSTESGDQCQTPTYSYSPLPTPSSVYSMKSCLSVHGPIPLSPPCSKTVTFSPHPPAIYDAPSNEEYDRTPHAVVPRLTYRDVLEMREVLQMTVELGIFAKRDNLRPASADSSTAPSPVGTSSSSTLPTVPASVGPLGSDFPFPRPPRLSEFPNSTKLVSTLNDMPLCPPQPAPGMGMTVVNGGEGLDGVANRKPKAKPVREPSASPPSEDEETEFAKEVREAREQLAELEVAKMRERERVDLERVKARTGAPTVSSPLFTATGIPGASTAIGLDIAPGQSSSAGPSRKSSCDDLQGSRSALFFGTAWNGACSPALSSSSSTSVQHDTSTLRPPPSLAPQKRHLSPPISPRHHHFASALHSPLPEREPSPHPAPRGSFFPSPMASPPSPKRSALPPTSPILAPFARSTPLATVTERRSEPTPPSPILAPFARSAKLN